MENYDQAGLVTEGAGPLSTDTKDGLRSGRNGGIDAMRFVAIAAVVLLHSLPPTPPPMSAGDAVVAMACRFAVPFFFLVAGYFLRIDGRGARDLITRPLLRLVPVYLGALAIYYVAWHALGIEPWHLSLRDLRNGGPIFHLWFLPALGVGLVFTGVGVRYVGLRATIAAAALLAIAGLGLTSYRELYAAALPGNRSGWLFAPLYVVAGQAIARGRSRVRLAPALALMGGSYALLVGEEAMLQHLSGAPVIESHDFMLATLPFGVGALLTALARGQTTPPMWSVRAGRMALGLYIFHLLFLRLLRPAIGTGSAGAILLLATATLAATLLSVIALARLPVMRRLVS